MSVQMSHGVGNVKISQLWQFVADHRVSSAKQTSPPESTVADGSRKIHLRKVHLAKDWKAWDPLRLTQNIEHGFTVLGKPASAALGSHGSTVSLTLGSGYPERLESLHFLLYFS